MASHARSRPRAFAFADSGESSYARPAENGEARERSWTSTRSHLQYVDPASSEPRGLRRGRGTSEELDLNAPTWASG